MEGARHRATMGGTVQTLQDVRICRCQMILDNDAEDEGEAEKEEAVVVVALEELQCAQWVRVPRTRTASAETTKVGSRTGAGAVVEKSVAAGDASAAAVSRSCTSWRLACPPMHDAVRPFVQVHPASSATPAPNRGTAVQSVL